jgi:AcrR family transcriptional regulator
MTALTAKQAKFENKRIEVIRGAARVFARLGFHGASLNDVADELNITPAALYYYVKSKDELLHEASTFATERLVPILDALNADKTQSVLEKLRSYFRAYAEYTYDDFGRCLAVTNPYDMPSPYREASLAGRRQLTNFVRELIREGIGDGSIRDCDDRLLSYVLFGAANTLARVSPTGPLSPHQTMDAMLDMIIDGIAQTPSSKPAAPRKSPSKRQNKATSA